MARLQIFDLVKHLPDGAKIDLAGTMPLVFSADHDTCTGRLKTLDGVDNGDVLAPPWPNISTEMEPGYSLTIGVDAGQTEVTVDIFWGIIYLTPSIF